MQKLQWQVISEDRLKECWTALHGLQQGLFNRRIYKWNGCGRVERTGQPLMWQGIDTGEFAILFDRTDRNSPALHFSW